jgi:hypothetical protein
VPELATIEVTAIGEDDGPAIARAETRDQAETIRESVTAVSRDQIQTVDIEAAETGSMFEPDVDAEYMAKNGSRSSVSRTPPKMSSPMSRTREGRYRPLSSASTKTFTINFKTRH